MEKTKIDPVMWVRAGVRCDRDPGICFLPSCDKKKRAVRALTTLCRIVVVYDGYDIEPPPPRG